MRAGSKPFPGSGRALLVTEAGSAVFCAGDVRALTTTVFVLLPIQPAAAPIPSARAPPSSAIARTPITSARTDGPRRTGAL